MNDNYSAASGHGIYAGRFNVIESVASGGTVNALARSITTSGFNLLTTAPATAIYRNSPHAGFAWDRTREALWIFGAETHSVASDYDNSLYVFETKTGIFKKIYQQSPWPSNYCISDSGFLWADNDETLPWACHTYQSMHYEEDSAKLTVAIDVSQHSYTTPIQKGQTAFADRKVALLQYDTINKKWSQSWTADTQTFLKASFTNGIGFSKKWGMVFVDGVYLRRLSAEGVYSQVSVYGKSNTQYHDSSFFIGDDFFKFGGNGNAQDHFCSIHPMNNLATAYVKLKSNYPALSGWDMRNKPAVPTPSGNILFIAVNGTNAGAFIYNPANDTVSDTGYRLSGITGNGSTYDFKLVWAESLGGALYLSNLSGNPSKIYLIKV